MSSVTPQPIDADFFAMVHQVLEEDHKQQQQQIERRGDPRRSFECVQLVAPVQDGRMPGQSEFRHVKFQDLSSQGFSYHALRSPDHCRVVVALGAVPFTFLLARVVHVTTIQEEGRTQYLVGCQFDSRIPA